MSIPTLQQGFAAAHGYLMAPTNPHAEDARIDHEDEPHAILGSYFCRQAGYRHATGILVVDPVTLATPELKRRYLRLLFWRDQDRAPGPRYAVVWRCGVTDEEVRAALLHLDRHRSTFTRTFAERHTDLWRAHAPAPKL